MLAGEPGAFFSRSPLLLPPGVTDIVSACGSGGTTAGLGLGNHLSGLGARVLAYGVCDTPEYFYRHGDEMLCEIGASPAVLGRSSRGLFEIRQAKGAG